MIPVDMPLLTRRALRALADACRDVAVPPSGPLPGAYRRSALPALERALAEAGSRSATRSPGSTSRRVDLDASVCS